MGDQGRSGIRTDKHCAFQKRVALRRQCAQRLKNNRAFPCKLPRKTEQNRENELQKTLEKQRKKREKKPKKRAKNREKTTKRAKKQKKTRKMRASFSVFKWTAFSSTCVFSGNYACRQTRFPATPENARRDMFFCVAIKGSSHRSFLIVEYRQPQHRVPLALPVPAPPTLAHAPQFDRLDKMNVCILYAERFVKSNFTPVAKFVRP